MRADRCGSNFHRKQRVLESQKVTGSRRRETCVSVERQLKAVTSKKVFPERSGPEQLHLLLCASLSANACCSPQSHPPLILTFVTEKCGQITTEIYHKFAKMSNV